MAPFKQYTACVAAADLAGNMPLDSASRDFESADGSPPKLDVAVLWNSVQSDPVLRTCSCTLRLTADQPCDVAIALLHGQSMSGPTSGVPTRARCLPGTFTKLACYSLATWLKANSF